METDRKSPAVADHPIRRRRRPALSCLLCRQRKLRCNRDKPCSACVKSQEKCVYERFPDRPSGASQGGSDASEGPGSNSHQSKVLEPSTATPAIPAWSIVGPPGVHHSVNSVKTAQSPYPSPASVDELEHLRSTIRQLEDQLQKATTEQAAQIDNQIKTSMSGLTGDFHSLHTNNQPRGASRSVWHKTRLFGQSHWVNGVVSVRDVFDMIEPYFREDSTTLLAKIQKTKNLARVLKMKQIPEWPTAPMSDLPSRATADELVHNYFRTYESLFRVLHAPSFREQYEAIWVPGADRDETFVIQLKLIMAIGTGTQYSGPSLRSSASRWVFEAVAWLAKPNIKARIRPHLGIPFIQTHILSIFAREVTGIGEDVNWVQAGSLYRLAMHLGLHRDPARLPKTSTYFAEMRRRLWNTVIEVNLRCSILAGGSPLMTLDDFDTEPPGNFDDEELRQDEPRPKPEGEFSMTTISAAFRQTFPLRLRMTRFLNDIRSVNAYEDILALDAEYRTAYKDLRQHLQDCSSKGGDQPTDFQLRALELNMSRYLLSIHMPGFSAAMNDAAFAYSRTVVVETAYKIWSAAIPSPSSTNTTDDLAKLISTTSGFYRIAATQSCLALALDIRSQQRAFESLGPSPLRRDVAHLLDEMKSWQLQTIENGEPSVRGYIFLSVIIAHIEGLAKGLKKEDLAQFAVDAGEAAMDKTIPILERIVAESAPGEEAGAVDGMDPMDFSAPGGALMGWDFLTMDQWFDNAQMEPVMNEGQLYGPW